MNEPSPADLCVLVVVPTRNAARTIDACLRSIENQSHKNVRLVVVDNHSTDATAELAARAADEVITAGPERSAQRNIGAASAACDAVMFVDADMVLSADVITQAVRCLQAGVSAVVVPEVSFGEGFWASCKTLEKQLVNGDESVEGARVFTWEAFDEVGGYDETLTACEDWDLDDRVRACHGPAGRIDATIHHDEGRLRLRGTFAKKRYYGRWVSQYMRTAPAHRRQSRRLLSKRTWQMMARQPVVSAGLVTMKLVELAGFAAGMRDERRQGHS